MLRIAFIRVRQEQVNRLREWMHALSRRKDEVLETFAQEGVHHEVAYLLEDMHGPLLVYGMEVTNPEQARQAFQASTLPIDLEHGQIIKETTSGPVEMELLFECTRSTTDKG